VSKTEPREEIIVPKKPQDAPQSEKQSNAESYYAANAVLHGQEAVYSELSQVGATGRLPACPSEVDWAVYWLMQSGSLPLTSCLDVGCSKLNFLRSVGGMCEKRYGIDIVPFDNWSGHSNIITNICNLDEHDLPFDDGTFDFVVMLMVLEHVFNPFHAVRELRRVCKTTGQVVIGVPNIASIKNRLSLLLGRMPITSASFSFFEDAWDGYHLHNFTRKSFGWLLEREGLVPIAWGSAGRLQFLKNRRPSLFGGDLVVLCRPGTSNPGLPLQV
jgi:SAM-dependent methyltransferase